LSQETWALIDQRKVIKQKLISARSARLKQRWQDEYRQKDREIKRQVRVDKRRWTEEIAEEAENAAKQQHMKTLYTLTKVLSNERPRQSAAVMDKNGKILNDKVSKTKRRLEHFSEVLNRENPSNPVSEMEIELPDEIEEMDTSEPSRGEVRKAIGHLKNGKAPGIDNIQAELLKADVDYATTKVKEIIDIVWRDEKTPRKWRKGLIVKLPKKGNLKECKNWRGITLLSVVSKVMGRIVIDRIRTGVESKLRKEQASFRPGRGTTEQIFLLRNIIEQSIEWQSSLYVNFIDFEKAFDSVHRDSLWLIMRSYGIPSTIINMVKVLYADFECAVVDGHDATEWFKIKTGVKQGHNMSGLLFLLVVDWVMRNTLQEGNTGRRWKFTTKLEDLDFADDVALLSSTRQHIQTKTDKLAHEAERVGLKVNVDKCKLLQINSRNNDVVEVNGRGIEDVDRFVYLGATVSKEGGGTEDIHNRVVKARGVFLKLKKIWSSNSISRRTKVRLYKTLVKPVLMYGCETWKMNKSDENKIDVFQSRCLRRIFKICWQERITNKEVLKIAEMENLSEGVQKRRWKFIGHIMRKEPNNDCRTALTWTPEGR